MVYYYFARFGYSITTYNCLARYAGAQAGELQQLVPPTPPLWNRSIRSRPVQRAHQNAFLKVNAPKNNGTVARRCVTCRADSRRRNSPVNSAKRMSRLYDVRIPNVRDTAGSGIREKTIRQWPTPSSEWRWWVTTIKIRQQLRRDERNVREKENLHVHWIVDLIRWDEHIEWLVRRSRDGAGYVKTPTSAEVLHTVDRSWTTHSN